MQSAGSPACDRVAYVRTIDRKLGDDSAFARVAVLAARPAYVVNAPGSVRLAEWSPLASLALREHRVPQPDRIWCLDEGDVARAAELLGMPIFVEGVVEQRRVVASTPLEFGAALDAAMGDYPERGALVEAPIPGRNGELSVMVVDGACIPLSCGSSGHLSPRSRLRAAIVARDAVHALGGSAMAVEIAVTADDEVYVTRVDPAPRLERLSKAALAALVGAIVHRVGPLCASDDRRNLELVEPYAPRRTSPVAAERPV